MRRYTCVDCKKIKRCRDKQRGRCRKCLNNNLPGDGNRPNRRGTRK